MTGDHDDAAVIEQTLRIDAEPEVVWRYWTDGGRMSQWWGVAAELDPRPGGRCRVEMEHGPVMVGEYVELVPYQRIVFTFGWDPAHGGLAVPPGSSRVEVTLTPDADGTVLTLRHTGLPPAFLGQHQAGWDRFLPLLAAKAAPR